MAIRSKRAEIIREGLLLFRGILIFAVIAVVIGAFLYVGFNHPTNSNSTSEEDYKDCGFRPAC